MHTCITAWICTGRTLAQGHLYMELCTVVLWLISKVPAYFYTQGCVEAVKKLAVTVNKGLYVRPS